MEKCWSQKKIKYGFVLKMVGGLAWKMLMMQLLWLKR